MKKRMKKTKKMFFTILKLFAFTVFTIKIFTRRTNKPIRNRDILGI